MNDNDSYFCPVCEHQHKFTSKIGQEHRTVEPIAEREHDVQPGDYCDCGAPVFAFIDGKGMCQECLTKYRAMQATL